MPRKLTSSGEPPVKKSCSNFFSPVSPGGVSVSPFTAVCHMRQPWKGDIGENEDQTNPTKPI
jgi:hypothetical protein